MRIYARLALLLAAFMLVAGAIYGYTSYEWAGMLLLLIGALGFGYFGLYARRAVRSADRAARLSAAPAAADAELHIGPTIWPLVFSVAAGVLVIGLLASKWVLILAAVLFVAAALGWFRDVLAQRKHVEHLEERPTGLAGPQTEGQVEPRP